MPLESCFQCSKGRYADLAGQKTCIECEPGRYAVALLIRSTVFSHLIRMTKGWCNVKHAQLELTKKEMGPLAVLHARQDTSKMQKDNNFVLDAQQVNAYCLETSGFLTFSSSGRYSSDPVSGFGVSECSTCVPGTFSGPIARECSQCPARQVSTKPGQSECRACDVHSNANAFNSECLCDVGFYSDEREDVSSQCQVQYLVGPWPLITNLQRRHVLKA